MTLNQQRNQIAMKQNIAKSTTIVIINKISECTILLSTNKITFIILFSVSFTGSSHRTRKYRRYVNKNAPANSAVSKPSHRVTETFSVLSIEISEDHAGGNGRLELTCLATIPSHLGNDTQYADYKTHSLKSEYIDFFITSYFRFL